MDYLQYFNEFNDFFTLKELRFKPYYNWNTFNTIIQENKDLSDDVLNLVISGIPSIPKSGYMVSVKDL